MIKQLGPLTLFITCYTTERFSEPLIEHIRNLNRDTVPNVDSMTPSELCAVDPVTVGVHFHNKWHSIFTNLIKSVPPSSGSGCSLVGYTVNRGPFTEEPHTLPYGRILPTCLFVV